MVSSCSFIFFYVIDGNVGGRDDDDDGGNNVDGSARLFVGRNSREIHWSRGCYLRSHSLALGNDHHETQNHVYTNIFCASRQPRSSNSESRRM